MTAGLACPSGVFATMALASALLAGCAGLQGGAPLAAPFRDTAMTVHEAERAVIVGQSVKADVLAVLGPATSFRFDSGYEVWVYGAKSARTTSRQPEFVVLFAPSGVVSRTRVRPVYPSDTP